MKTTIWAAVLILVGGTWLFLHNTATPAPAVVVAPPKPTPKPRRYAPAGTYYTLTYISQPTKSGIIGFPPGQELTLVEKHGDAAWLMSDGKYNVEICPDKLTNDLDAAAKVATTDTQEQNVLSLQASAAAEKARRDLLSTLAASEPDLHSNVIGRGKSSALNQGPSRVGGGAPAARAPVFVNQYGQPVPMHSL